MLLLEFSVFAVYIYICLKPKLTGTGFSVVFVSISSFCRFFYLEHVYTCYSTERFSVLDSLDRFFCYFLTKITKYSTVTTCQLTQPYHCTEEKYG